mgnify:CR=1 FL=1
MNKKIFIIEDEEKIRLELSTFLNRYGYETSYSDDFENIVEIALKEKALAWLNTKTAISWGIFKLMFIQQIANSFISSIHIFINWNLYISS